ncbi:LysR family transcriptional regulator, partial [Lactobacillus crispatus]
MDLKPKRMIIMEINKLKTFVELASTLSFSKTAANLFINQSSVSK